MKKHVKVTNDMKTPNPSDVPSEGLVTPAVNDSWFALAGHHHFSRPDIVFGRLPVITLTD